eukprot:TRINITY_DN8911_c0_g1_i1.p1 TRINITY_DN8911_c0_g1~~TRINITY_DN8911_c0_g1_i1.p1  ORF type:complete len:683 (+),score=145.68 TRINITY_DN8911_c0_g1_i1:55-2103(+)
MTIPAILLSCAVGWSNVDQFKASSIADTSVSSDGKWMLFSTAGTRQDSDNTLFPTAGVYLQGVDGTKTAVSQFCDPSTPNQCAMPRFCSDGKTVVFVHSAASTIAKSTLNGNSWSNPTTVTTLPKDESVVSLQCNADTIYFSSSSFTPAPTKGAREIEDDIIINVISEAPIGSLNKLCRVQNTAGGQISCFEGLEKVSVGAVGWYLSCWQYATDFEVNSKDDSLIAMTTTDTLNGNDWELMRSRIYNTKTGALTTLSSLPSFQTKWSADGSKVAFTEIDHTDYTWAQTWHICVFEVASHTVKCAADGNSTIDQMPSLIGWSENDSKIMFLQQIGTSVVVSKMDAATLTCDKQVTQPPHVVGGGFRASMIPVYEAGSDKILITKETPTGAPGVYLCDVATVDSCSNFVKTDVNADLSPLPAISHEITTYKSFDGEEIEMISLGANNSKLLVFTHCGPAMAQLSTYMGFGTVCAGFPVISLVLSGYHVVMPNYRGSSGYGAAFRRSDANDWGGSDYKDIIEAMKQFGVAQNKKIAHFGWSYGGYMSSLMLTRAKATDNIDIQAIVGGGTLNDLISHVGTTDINRLFPSVYGGKNFWDDKALAAKMMDHSAIYHVINATAPTLMLHGVDDPRMPLSQAWQLHQALRRRSVTTRFVVFPGSGHIPGNPNQRMTILNETLFWFQKHF